MIVSPVEFGTTKLVIVLTNMCSFEKKTAHIMCWLCSEFAPSLPRARHHIASQSHRNLLPPDYKGWILPARTNC